MTEDRKQKFLKALAETGSWRYASAAASGHLVQANGGVRPKAHYGEQTFYSLMKRDPEFAEAVQAALSVAVGRAEHMLTDRMATPDRRPVLDRSGGIVGYDEQWRSANVLLLRFLERHAPEQWTPRKQIDGTQTVVHSDVAVGSGAAYVLRPADILLLPPEKRAALIALLEDVEQAREGQAPALPAPAPAALPAPVQEDVNGQP